MNQMSRFKSLKKPSLSQAVTDQLIDSISSGVFKPGDKLPSERELMSQFEVIDEPHRVVLRWVRDEGAHVRFELGVSRSAKTVIATAWAFDESA